MIINQTSFGDNGRPVTRLLRLSERGESGKLEPDDEGSILIADD